MTRLVCNNGIKEEAKAVDWNEIEKLASVADAADALARSAKLNGFSDVEILLPMVIALANRKLKAGKEEGPNNSYVIS